MYSNEPGTSLRQGDILRGQALLSKAIETSKAAEYVHALQNGGNLLPSAIQVNTYQLMLLSQCCDIERDDPLLVAELLPYSALGVANLTDDQRNAFHSNALALKDGQPIVELEARDVGAADLTLILPGFFYLPALDGVIDSPRVVKFSIMRAIRRRELERLSKVAELAKPVRSVLRNKLALFFGRVPEEDTG